MNHPLLIFLNDIIFFLYDPLSTSVKHDTLCGFGKHNVFLLSFIDRNRNTFVVLVRTAKIASIDLLEALYQNQAVMFGVIHV